MKTHTFGGMPKNALWGSITIAALCIGLTGCQTDSPGGLAGSLQSSLNDMKATLTPDGGSAPGGSEQGVGLEGTPLNNLFASHPFNTKIPFDKQYPRVALTILKAPPNASTNWVAPTYASIGHQTPHGCFELSAVLWESRTKSTSVPPFTACFPGSAADAARFRNMPLKGAGDWIGNTGYFAVVDESTGNQRTDGPVPPDSPVPTGPRYQRFYGLPYLDTNTITGGMFALLLLKMDFDWSQGQDRRVWITRIVPAE